MSNIETQFCALATPFYVRNPDGTCNGDAVSAALTEGFNRDDAVPVGSNITNDEYAEQYDCRFCPKRSSYIGPEMTGNCVPDSILSSNVSDEISMAFLDKILNNDGCGVATTRPRNYRIAGYFDEGYVTQAGLDKLMNKPIPVCSEGETQQCLQITLNPTPTPGYDGTDFWQDEVVDA